MTVVKYNKKWLTVLATLIVILFVATVIYIDKNGALLTEKEVKMDTVVTPSPTTTVTATPSTTTSASRYYYPISDYTSRLSVRWYGKYVSSSETAPSCGSKFVGYHNGDDLEVSSSEVNSRVNVYSVADAVVKQLGFVSGYGGLIVLSAELNGASYTVYYGHINMASVSKTVGSRVSAGETLAELGSGCSAQTDGERKHLHFAIRKGDLVDVRGYVQSTGVLSGWLNPKDFLLQIGAKNK